MGFYNNLYINAAVVLSCVQVHEKKDLTPRFWGYVRNMIYYYNLTIFFCFYFIKVKTKHLLLFIVNNNNYVSWINQLPEVLGTLCMVNIVHIIMFSAVNIIIKSIIFSSNTAHLPLYSTQEGYE